MAERWLRMAGAKTQFHRFRDTDGISCCGMLHLDERPFAMETPGGFPQYFCRRCVDIKAAESRRKGGA